MHGLPFKMRFRESRLYISVIPPIIIGFGVGVLSAIMGVGGGFVVVPAMIYLLRMPTNVVMGTSLFQIIVVTAATTVLQATTNYSVDIVLALFLILGGVIGAQIRRARPASSSHERAAEAPYWRSRCLPWAEVKGLFGDSGPDDPFSVSTGGP